MYVPEGHAVALTDDVKGQNEPSRQGTGDDSPGVGQTLPRGQARQVAFEDAPVALLYVPGGQFVISIDINGQKEPDVHSTGSPDAQKNPAGHGPQVNDRMRLPPSSPTTMTPVAVTSMP